MLWRTHEDGLFDLAHPLVDRELVLGVTLCVTGHQIFFTRIRIGWLSPTTASTPCPAGRANDEPDEPNCTDSVSSMISSWWATVAAQTSSSPLTVRLIRSLMSRSASRRAC